jgi:hypothetical protein
MAFVLKQKPTYTWPLVLIIPNAGKKERHAFDAIYNRLPQSRIDELIELARVTEQINRGRVAVTDEQEEPEKFITRDVAREVMAGWNDVVDDKGEPVPFTTSALDQLLEIPTVADQIVRGFFASIDAAKRKN